MASQRSLDSASSRSASSSLVSIFEPLFGSYMRSSKWPSMPDRRGFGPCPCSCSWNFCLSSVRESRAEEARWYWISAASRLERTSLSALAMPALKASSADRPDTCSACTCLRWSCFSRSRAEAMCVNGSESSVSDCESMSSAGPSCPRSEAISESVCTKAWCLLAAVDTTLSYSRANTRSFSISLSSGTFCRNVSCTRLKDASVPSKIEANQEPLLAFLTV
mmetsp:Transcript_32436/g.71104  ORF Transcript_32436/g.71104 Transcript_32436/m.71104 type:complete len:221 (-) Transcript_32436:536-1198(-)